MKHIKQLLRYLYYIINAKNEHGIHSPFVFDLYTNIIKDKNPFYIFGPIESLRAKMYISNEEIAVEDMGTGSSGNRKISTIAKNSVKDPKYAQLLFRLLNHFDCNNVLEIGTSLGITTCYLSSFSKNAKVITLEGCQNTSNIARSNFKKLNLNNIEVITGAFDNTLQPALEKMNTVDFVFIDGNHKYEPTIEYFNQCLRHINDSSILVFDDIHWSNEMEAAWKTIQSHEQTTCTIDLYELGIVFFKKEIKKSDFVLFL